MAAFVLFAFSCVASSAASSLRPAPGESLGSALHLAALPNLRDIGGYRTRSGATVVEGLLYRSNAPSGLGSGDIAALARLGLKSDYDLRTAEEARAKPDAVLAGVRYARFDVLADSRAMSPAEIERLLHDPKKANAVLGRGRIDAIFTGAYREFVSLPSARTAYRSLFLALADRRNLPALVHCTGGKDRTGWAAAALLTLLGVPRQALMADFLKSNAYLMPQYRAAIDGFVARGGDREIALAIFGLKPGYLNAAFAEMTARYGTIERYFSDGLGLDAAQQKALRELYSRKD